MNKPFLGRFTHLTHAQIIFILLSIQLVWIAYLTGDIQHNIQVSIANQDNLAQQTSEIQHVIEAQGNLSSAQRNALLQQFANVSNHGGFSTKDIQLENLAQVKALNLKLDKLLNQTSGSK